MQPNQTLCFCAKLAQPTQRAAVPPLSLPPPRSATIQSDYCWAGEESLLTTSFPDSPGPRGQGESFVILKQAWACCSSTLAWSPGDRARSRGKIIKDILCQESLSRGSSEEPTGEGKTGGLERKRRWVRNGRRRWWEESGGGSMEREGERGRARMQVSISSPPSPPARCTPPPPRSSAQLAKQQVLSAAQQISSEERQKLFPFLFFPFLRWPANVILHTRNGLAVSSTNFRGDNLTFTPPSLHPPPNPLPLSFFISLPLYVFHQVSSLKGKLKKQSTATGCGVARAFLRAQAALFGSYRDALRYKPVRTQSSITTDHQSLPLLCYIYYRLFLLKEFMIGYMFSIKPRAWCFFPCSGYHRTLC